ncbi:Scd6 protein [Martiniozyma asiatica (nom. inval.)]|nr:Scd6 protein [Martiniozyma asiatica]
MDYQGKTLSVTTFEEVRYVGVLQSIDPTAGTLTLTTVRNLGTEGRVLDPANVKFPVNEKIAVIQLGGQEVKELNILDCAVDEVNVSLPSQVLDKCREFGVLPAEYDTHDQPLQFKQETYDDQMGRGDEDIQNTGATANNSTKINTNTNTNTGASASANTNTGASASANRTAQQSFDNSHGTNKNLQETNVTASPDVHAGAEFDFEANNRKFLEQKGQMGGETSYNKSKSFFDTLSTNNDRLTWQQEKEMNIDTFGETSLNGNGSFRGRGGRGRGRRGRGRGGRGRGNSNSNYNFNSNSNGNASGRGNYRGGRAKPQDEMPEWAF